MEVYSHWLRQAFPQPRQRQQYFRSLIEGKPISHANFRLAHLLIERKLASLIVTPNFDNFLQRALTLFGAQPIVCDHPATTERIDPESQDIQIVHVHGTYWFYDLCNLPGEIKDRSADSPQRAVTMLSLLYDILARHSAIVIGYSGWEDDVIMTALKRRLSGNLPTNLYWFCYRRSDVEFLPAFVRNHDNVCIVQPPQAAKQSPTSRVASDDDKLASPPSDFEPTLEARVVLDKLVSVFTHENPALTADPIGFFTKQLTDSFPRERSEKPDDDIYRLRDVIRRVEEARRTEKRKPVEAEIEVVTNSLRRSSYEEVITRAEGMKLNQLSSAQRATLIDLVMSASIGLNNDSDAEVRGYDLILRLARGKLAKRPSVKQQIALALMNKAYIAGLRNRPEEELGIYNDVLERFQQSPDPELTETLARALLYKGITLGQLGHRDQEINSYAEVLRSFGSRTEPPLLEIISVALVNQGVALAAAQRLEEAARVFDQAEKQFGSAPKSDIRERIAGALLNHAVGISKLGNGNREIEIYDEIVRRFAESEEQTIREIVAKALFNKGLTLAHSDRREDALRVFDDVLSRLGEARNPSLREAAAGALFNKALLLSRLRRDTEALTVYDELTRRFGQDPEPALRDRVARGLYSKAICLTRLKRFDTAIEAYDEIIGRLGDPPDTPSRDQIARALQYKASLLGKLGRREDETRIYEELIARFQNATEPPLRTRVATALLNLGSALAKLGKEDDAKEKLTEAVRRSGESEDKGLKEILSKAQSELDSLGKGNKQRTAAATSGPIAPEPPKNLPPETPDTRS